MKRVLFVISLCVLFLLFESYLPKCHTPLTYVPEKLTEWQVFTLALIDVESEYQDSAVNKSTGARGVLQIMPVYVRECNRLQKAKVYSFDDAYNPVKSMEMLNIINPEKDIELAIKRHNPRAGKWYRKRILDRMENIKKLEEKRRML